MITFINTLNGERITIPFDRKNWQTIIDFIKAGVPFYLWLMLDSHYSNSFHTLFILLNACRIKTDCAFYNTDDEDDPVVYRTIDGILYRVDTKTYETIL